VVNPNGCVDILSDLNDSVDNAVNETVVAENLDDDVVDGLVDDAADDVVDDAVDETRLVDYLDYNHDSNEPKKINPYIEHNLRRYHKSQLVNNLLK